MTRIPSCGLGRALLRAVAALHLSAPAGRSYVRTLGQAARGYGNCREPS